MSIASNPQPEDQQPAQAFYELRSWVDERLIAKGLHPGPVQQTRREAAAITLAHIEQLKADIAGLIQLEGRRSLWSGLGINLGIFVLGLVSGVGVDVVKAGLKWPF